MSSKENLTKMDENKKMEPKNVSNPPRKGRRGVRKTSNEAEKDTNKKTVADSTKVDPVDMMFM